MFYDSFVALILPLILENGVIKSIQLKCLLLVGCIDYLTLSIHPLATFVESNGSKNSHAKLLF